MIYSNISRKKSHPSLGEVSPPDELTIVLGRGGMNNVLEEHGGSIVGGREGLFHKRKF